MSGSDCAIYAEEERKYVDRYWISMVKKYEFIYDESARGTKNIILDKVIANTFDHIASNINKSSLFHEITGEYIFDQWIIFLKLLKFAHDNKSNEGEDESEEWEHYEEMKFFLPYVKKCLKLLEEDSDCETDEEVQSVNISIKSSRSNYLESKETKYQSDVDCNESVDSDSESVTAGSKPARLYKFKFRELDRRLINEVEKNPFLYATSGTKDKEKKAMKWNEIAEVVFGTEHVETNPLAG